MNLPSQQEIANCNDSERLIYFSRTVSAIAERVIAQLPMLHHAVQEEHILAPLLADVQTLIRQLESLFRHLETVLEHEGHITLFRRNLVTLTSTTHEFRVRFQTRISILKKLERHLKIDERMIKLIKGFSQKERGLRENLQKARFRKKGKMESLRTHTMLFVKMLDEFAPELVIKPGEFERIETSITLLDELRTHLSDISNVVRAPEGSPLPENGISQSYIAVLQKLYKATEEAEHVMMEMNDHIHFDVFKEILRRNA